jgi:exonuclease SbcC
MIPVSLTLSGIYSYQQPQTIDFTKLTEASIFGIFGSVGSGKSTILEAISYALYGETERLNQRENRGYNMMNLKSNELLIDFIFRAGDGEQEYRFKVTGKRNRNHFDRINTFERTAYQKQEEEWLPIDVGNAEQIIGLSYQNFRRTIIIPQGKFQEFLQLGDTERTRMMKELFNLNKYELFHKVTGLEKKNSDERMVLEDRLKQIGEIDASQIDLRKESLAGIQKNIEANAQALTEKQQVDSAFAQLKELFERIQVQQSTLLSLQAKEADYDKLGEQIRNYEYCLVHFKGLLDNQQSIRNEINRLSEAIGVQQAGLQKIRNRLAAEEAACRQLQATYDRREDWKKEAEELEKIVQVLDLESQAELRRERISNGEMFYSRAINNLAQIRQAQEALTAEIRVLKASLPNTAVLSAVSHWFAVNNQLQTQKISLISDAEQVHTKLRQLTGRKDELLIPELRALVPKANLQTALQPLLSLFEEAGSVLDRETGQLEQELQHLLLQSKLEAYATALHEGAPCPLCGSTEHPHKLNASEVNEVLFGRQQRKGQLLTSRALLETYGKKLAQLVVQDQAQREQLEQIQQKLKAQETSLDAHRQAFQWSDFRPDDEAHFKASLSEANRLQKEIEEKEGRLENLSRQLPTEEQNREKYRLALEKLQKEVAGISGRAGIYRDQITQLDIATYAHRKPADLREQAQKKLIQYESIEAGFRAAEKLIQSLRVESGTLSGSIQTGEDSLKNYQDQAEAVERQLQEHVEASTFSALNEVLAVLKLPLELEREKKRYDAFRQQLHTTQTQHHTLVEQAQGRNYDGQAHAELLADITRLREERNTLRRQSVTLENEISKLEKDLKLRRTLLQQLDTLQQRAEDISTLKKMFRESGFVNYVSSVYLQNLCKAANERFYKLTRQKLQLEITEKNEFQIRDFLHNGQVRSVKTLSGGQTFQAALCLALALADNIQQLTQSSQNFFFLDEGFGSLDRDSLQIVFDTLKALRKENRIVGVISHVEEMQYEIDTYLKIANDEVTGSVVYPSWRK